MTTINDTLKIKLDDKEAIVLVNDLAECLNSMKDQFNALLNVSELESGSIMPKLANFRVDELFRGIDRLYRPLAEHKGLCLRVAWSSAIIHSDRALLGQMIDNLVSNAIRYTEAGKILFGCRRRGSMLKIEVWDTGVGIPECKHEQIFDEFYQLDNPARNRSKGLGLGLAIATRSAQLLGTQIELKSWNKGSLFSVKVPIVGFENSDKHISVKALTKVVTEESSSTGAPLLVVDDSKIVLCALTYLLESYGYEVTGASSGKEALELLSSGSGPFKLLITDYRLPEGVTGLELINTVRRTFKLAIPALIITGDQEVVNRPDVMALDLRVLQKPVAAEILNRHIKEMLT